MKTIFNLLMIWALAFLIPVVKAQNISSKNLIKATLSGKITDSRSGQSLEGVSVFFPDLKIGSATDAQGIYKIQNISEGSYMVEVSLVGYSSIQEVIVLKGNVQKDFTLSPSVVENAGVTVTGVSRATSVRKTPVPVNIVKKEDLFQNVSTNLIDNLSKTPGVSQVTTGPAISKPFIRGLGYNRVVVVNDGIRQEGQQWGDEHGIEIDELNVNRAEVLKCPASLMYGSDALAGVVNIISILPSPEGSVKGNVFGTYQTNNRQRNFHADLGGNNKGFVWGIYGSYKAAADYKNKYDGYVFNSKFNEKDFGGYIGANKNWGFTHLYFSRFDQRLGIVEGDRDDATGKFIKLVNVNGTEGEEIATGSDFKSTDPYIPGQRIRHTKIATDNSFNIGQDRLTATIGYQLNQRQEFGDVTNPSASESYFYQPTVNYNIQYHFAQKNDWRTTIGVNGMQQRSKNRGEEALIPEYSLFDIGGFIYSQKTINKLTVSGGVRFDNRSLNSKERKDGTAILFEAFKKHFSDFSGSIGLAYEVNDKLTWKFNIARGYRTPNIIELAANGVHEGTTYFNHGSLDLKPETSLQADAGILINSEHVSFEANIFYNHINDFIFQHKLQSSAGGDSIVNIIGNNFTVFKYAADNASLYGAEFNLDIHPHPLDWLHIENSFSWVRGKFANDLDGSKNLPFIPAAHLTDEIKADLFKKGKTIRNCFLKVQLDNTFEQGDPFTGFNTETKTPGYAILNMGLGADITNKGKTLFNIFMGANNITNVAYQNHLSRLKYASENLVTGRMGVFNMGRSFSLKVNVPFNLKSK